MPNRHALHAPSYNNTGQMREKEFAWGVSGRPVAWI